MDFGGRDWQVQSKVLFLTLRQKGRGISTAKEKRLHHIETDVLLEELMKTEKVEEIFWIVIKRHECSVCVRLFV